MRTKLLKMTEDNLDFDGLKKAGDILKNGGLVAFPTETVYGLGGNALDALASNKIYAAKGRPSDNPLIVHISDMGSLDKIAREIPENAKVLAKRLWPGPLTMILNKTDAVPYETTGGLETVAIRFPKNKIALQLITDAGGYVAAPSANISGRPSPTMASHVYDDLNGRIEMIIDGGDCEIGLESTIIDFTEGMPSILRPGYYTKEMIEECIGEIRIDPGITSENTNIRPKAPGMRYKHYAPRSPLAIVEGDKAAVIAKINSLVSDHKEHGKTVGVICTDETKPDYKGGLVISIGARKEEHQIASHLYSVLRDFDDEDVSYIYSELFDTPLLGQAIMNRLLKAAGHEIINA